MKVRHATRDDIESFAPHHANKPTMKAWAGEVDGRVIALGGIAFCEGRWFGFCDLTEEARQYKITIMRTAKRVIEHAHEHNIRFIYAAADPREQGAVRWMESLGFTLDERSGLYRWGG